MFSNPALSQDQKSIISTVNDLVIKTLNELYAILSNAELISLLSSLSHDAKADPKKFELQLSSKVVFAKLNFLKKLIEHPNVINNFLPNSLRINMSETFKGQIATNIRETLNQYIETFSEERTPTNRN
jgi:hypothetical protein